MNKKIFVSLFVLFTLVLASCAPAVEAPAVEEPVEVAPEEPVVDVDAVCAADDFGCAVIPPGETIKIGRSGPMTGGNAAFGIDSEQAGLIAVEDAGELHGFLFELIAEDDFGTPEGGAAVANKLVADPTVVGVAGPMFSGASFAAMPIYEEAGIPMLTPSATNPRLAQMDSRVFNRLTFNDADQGRLAGEYMFNVLGFTRVAFLHDGGDYGKGLVEIASATFEELGGEVVYLEGITKGEADYSPVLSTIAALQPQALYFGGYTSEGAPLVNSMLVAGMEDVVFFGCDGTYGDDFLERTGVNGEGSFHTGPRLPPASPELDAFNATYLERWGVKPGAMSPFTLASYDTVIVLTNIVKEVAMLGADGSLYIPRGALADGVRNLTDWTGISGTYTCPPVGNCSALGPQLWVVQDGKFVTVN